MNFGVWTSLYLLVSWGRAKIIGNMTKQMIDVEIKKKCKILGSTMDIVVESPTSPTSHEVQLGEAAI